MSRRPKKHTTPNQGGDGNGVAQSEQYSPDEVFAEIHRYFQKKPFEYHLNGNSSPYEGRIAKNCNEILEEMSKSFVPEILKCYGESRESATHIAANAVSFAARYMGASYQPKKKIHDYFGVDEIFLVNNWQKHLKDIII